MPDLVLDRAGDPAGDVELRRDVLAGLADLGRVRVPAGVDDRARRRDRAAERLRQLLDEREVLRAAEPAAAGDDRRRRPRSTARLCSSCACSSIVALVEKSSSSTGDLDDLGLAAALGGLERAGADERERGARPSSRRRRTTVSPSAGRLPTSLPSSLREVDEIPVQAGVEPGGKAGGDVGRQHGRGEQHGVVAACLDHLREHVDARLRQRRLERRVVGDPDLGRAVAPACRRAPRRRSRRSRPRPRRRRATPPWRARRARPSGARRSWCSRKTRVAI